MNNKGRNVVIRQSLITKIIVKHRGMCLFVDIDNIHNGLIECVNNGNEVAHSIQFYQPIGSDSILIFDLKGFCVFV